MIYTEIIQNTGGRTAHKLIDLITAFCFYFISGYETIRNDNWKSVKNNCNNHIDMFNLGSSYILIDKPMDYVTIKYELMNWHGMEYTKFAQIIEEINKLQKDNINKSIIVQLSRSTRVQLCDIYNWDKHKLIKEGTYSKLTSHLRELLLSYQHINQLKVINHKQDCINICMHIRKGDVFTRNLHKCLKYFINVINTLKKINFKKHLYIFTEKWNGYDGKDVFDLMNLSDDNLCIKIIFETCLYEYFNDIIDTDIFVAAIGQGGFSDMITHYRNKHTIVIYNNKLRSNEFEDSSDHMIIQTGWWDKYNKTVSEKPGFFDVDSIINNPVIKKKIHSF